LVLTVLLFLLRSYAYLVTSLGVVGSSVLYFLAGYWDFYNAVKDSGKLYYLTVNNRTEAIQPTLPVDDELHFWLRAGLFLCVIVLALFSLAGMAVVASYRICNGGWTKVIVFSFSFLTGHLHPT
jgi:hypothetical protein